MCHIDNLKRINKYLVIILFITILSIPFTVYSEDISEYRTFKFDESFKIIKDRLNSDLCPLEFDQTTYFGDMDYPKNHYLKAKKMPFLPIIYFQFKSGDVKKISDDDKKLMEVIIQFNKQYFTFENLYKLLVDAYGDSEDYKPRLATWKKMSGNFSMYIVWRTDESKYQPEIVFVSGKSAINESKQIEDIKKRNKYNDDVRIEAIIHVPYSSSGNNKFMLSGGNDNNPNNVTIRIINLELLNTKN